MAPQISYLTLGQRIVSMIDANLQLLAQTAAYRWSVGVLRRLGITGRGLVIAVPAIWLLLFFLIPFVIVVKISLAPSVFVGQPPYGPLIEWTSDHVLQLKLHVRNYRDLFGQDALYFQAFVYSLKVAAVSTVLCLLIAYPMAYGIARASPNWRNTLLLLVVLPFWTSFLIRVYAWIGLLRNNGLINHVLMSLGIIDEPIVMMQTDFAMYVGIVYSYLPFMILPLYANLEKHDVTLLEAATDLGATPMRAFLRITLPLSMPGIIAGSMLVFIPAVGEFVIPRLLGGTDSLMIGRVLWDEFFTARSWPRASAVAVLLLLVLVLPIVIFQRYQARETSGLANR
ncbi:MAG TPA: ABC transporter permease subunit [Steroidobacteraceae bacterium]|jgi:putrescine transport system permease protein|nr:ABC transporter permease subunit [Steroidobacteraceae bacterium]